MEGHLAKVAAALLNILLLPGFLSCEILVQFKFAVEQDERAYNSNRNLRARGYTQ